MSLKDIIDCVEVHAMTIHVKLKISGSVEMFDRALVLNYGRMCIPFMVE